MINTRKVTSPERRARNRIWRENNPDKMREYSRKWRLANPAKRNSASKAWRERNPEKVQAWKKANSDKLAGYAAKYRAKYPDRFRASVRACAARRKKQQPEAVLWHGAKFRASKKGVPFNIEISDIIIPNVCPVLNLPLVFGKGKTCAGSPTLDRIEPFLGYVKGNIRVISHRANTLLSDSTLEEARLVYETRKRDCRRCK